MPDTTTPAAAPETTTPATEAPKTPTAASDDIDAVALERRFGIKRMKQTTAPQAKEESDSPAPAKKVEEVAGKPEEKATPAEAKALTKAFKIKVDGEEQEIPVAEAFEEFLEDWDQLSDKKKERLILNFQKSKAADKRFSESAMTAKRMRSLIEALKTNPLEVLSHPALGHNVRKMVEDYLVEQLELENMDPKDKELHELKHKIKKAEEKEKAETEAAKEKELEELSGQYRASYQKEIIDALETSGLPKTSETVKSMAHYMLEGLKRGVRFKASDVVDIVREDYTKKFQALFGQADADSIVNMFGDDFANKIRKHLLKNVKETGKTPEKQAEAREDQKEKKVWSRDEWRERMRKRVDGA